MDKYYNLRVGDTCELLETYTANDSLVLKGETFVICDFPPYLTYYYRKKYKERGERPKARFIFGYTSDNRPVRLDYFNIKKIK